MSVSPKSSSPGDFLEFLQKASAAGKAITWAGKMNELADQKSAAFTLMGLAGMYGFKPIIITQLPDDKLDDEVAKESYKKILADFAGKYKPDYIGLGNEINRMPNDKFAKHTQFYDEVYDAIKEKSPGTKVFTVFNLEGMKGLNGGLFGGTNDLSATEWFLLENTKKYDVIAFTTYPALIFKEPSDIPEDYYTEIKTKIFKPIAFTEIGWFRSGPPGWESSEQEQATFIRRFGELTKDVRSEFNIWPFLYDQNVAVPFNTAGLIGNTTAAWDAWLAI